MLFTDQDLFEIDTWLQNQAKGVSPGQVIAFESLDPDLGAGAYPGESIRHQGRSFTFHSYRAWMDLAEIRGFRFLTPQPIADGLVRFRFQLLPRGVASDNDGGQREKYGTASLFARIDKLADPVLVRDLTEALRCFGLVPGQHLLSLGVNRGDELAAVARILGPELFGSLRVSAVDHSTTALDAARHRFSADHCHFYCHDVRYLSALKLPKAHLVLALGLFQSPAVDGKNLIGSLVKQHTANPCGFILGFPNCRYRDGELVYGARMKNYSQPELSLLVKDLFFYRRYLQQHRFQVKVVGKYEVLLVAKRHQLIRDCRSSQRC